MLESRDGAILRATPFMGDIARRIRSDSQCGIRVGGTSRAALPSQRARSRISATQRRQSQPESGASQ